jgi:hypothetical protein
VPSVEIGFIGDEWQPFIVSSPQDRTAHITNLGTDHLYIFDPTVNADWKVLAGDTFDLPIVRQLNYTVKVCGTVLVTWTFL